MIRSVRELGRQNVSRLFGRALFNWGGIVRFDASSSVLAFAFAGGQAVGRAVPNDDAGAVGRSVGRWGAGALLIEYAMAYRPSMAMIGMRA